MVLLMISAIAVLCVLSAFFSSAETVLFSLTPAQRERIREKSQRYDMAISRSLEDKAILFSTILVGNTFVNFAISTIGYYLFEAMLPGRGWYAVPVMTVVLLIFGEITPKRLALRYSEGLAPIFSLTLIFWRLVLYPFNRILKVSSRAFAPALERERRALSDNELISVLDSAAEHGDISTRDAEMVEGVLRLSELCANDEMTPRVDIEGYDIDLPEARRNIILQSTKHSILPVFRRTPDVIEGIIEVKSGNREDALFVPETMCLDDLLVVFAKSGRGFAVVLDEYGGTAGIITQNDILELILGPAVFGKSADEPKIVKTGANVYEIDARASLDEINHELDVELEAEDADRLSGWVQFHAERLPHVGQEIEADGCRATVLKRRKRRVTFVKLEVLNRPVTESDEEIIAETDEAVERTEEDDE